jgi:outer membrane protein TolC
VYGGYYKIKWFSVTCLVICFFIPIDASLVFAKDESLDALRCDLATCIQVALTRHPDLQAAAAKKLAAQSKIDFEKTQWRPHLDFKGETGFLNGESVTPFSVIGGVTEEGIRQREVSGGYYAGTFSLSVPIVREGKILGWNSPSIQQARFSLTAEESHQRTRREQIIHDVTAAFINVLKASELVKENEQLIKLTEPQYQLALAKFRENLVSRNELLVVEVQLAKAKRELVVAKNGMARAQRELTKSMGLDAPTRVEILDTQALPSAVTPLPPMEDLLSFAFQHRPEVQAQEAQIQAKTEEVKRAQGQRFPTVELVAEYSLANAFDPPVSTQWRTVAQVTGSLFDFGRGAQKVTLARAVMTQEVKKMDSVKAAIAGEVQDAYTHITDTVAQIDLLEKQIEQATEALKLNRAMFRQQLLPESAVAEVEQALVKLEQAKVLANYDLILGHSQLALVTGGWQNKRPE